MCSDVSSVLLSFTALAAECWFNMSWKNLKVLFTFICEHKEFLDDAQTDFSLQTRSTYNRSFEITLDFKDIPVPSNKMTKNTLLYE